MEIDNVKHDQAGWIAVKKTSLRQARPPVSWQLLVAYCCVPKGHYEDYNQDISIL